jgi:hypothetical protein
VTGGRGGWSADPHLLLLVGTVIFVACGIWACRSYSNRQERRLEEELERNRTMLEMVGGVSQVLR